jgi:hypothetical protein
VNERRLPPIDFVGVASMMLTIVSTIWLAAHVPKRPPLAPSIGLMLGSGVLLLVNAVLLARLRDFAWRTFGVVAFWSLVAYVVIAGMIEFAFVHDGVRGAVLALLTLSLASFAVNVPILLAFGVARFQPPDGALAGPRMGDAARRF